MRKYIAWNWKQFSWSYRGSEKWRRYQSVSCRHWLQTLTLTVQKPVGKRLTVRRWLVSQSQETGKKALVYSQTGTDTQPWWRCQLLWWSTPAPASYRSRRRAGRRCSPVTYWRTWTSPQARQHSPRLWQCPTQVSDISEINLLLSYWVLTCNLLLSVNF